MFLYISLGHLRWKATPQPPDVAIDAFGEFPSSIPAALPLTLTIDQYDSTTALLLVLVVRFRQLGAEAKPGEPRTVPPLRTSDLHVCDKIDDVSKPS